MVEDVEIPRMSPDPPPLNRLGSIKTFGRRNSAVMEAEGRRAAHMVESAAPPVERPWWMKLHGDQFPVTNMEEVMEQFLGDSSAQNLEHSCQRAVRKVDIRKMDMIVPDISTEDQEAMQRWLGHVNRFLKCRKQVHEKHDRQIELKLHRKLRGQGAGAPEFPSEVSDSDDDGDGSMDFMGTGTPGSSIYGGFGGSLDSKGTGGRNLRLGSQSEESDSQLPSTKNTPRASVRGSRFAQIGTAVVKQNSVLDKLRKGRPSEVPTAPAEMDTLKAPSSPTVQGRTRRPSVGGASATGRRKSRGTISAKFMSNSSFMSESGGSR